MQIEHDKTDLYIIPDSQEEYDKIDSYLNKHNIKHDWHTSNIPNQPYFLKKLILVPLSQMLALPE